LYTFLKDVHKLLNIIQINLSSKVSLLLQWLYLSSFSVLRYPQCTAALTDFPDKP